MIVEATKHDILNLRVLCTQVWLHTYAKLGVRDEISKFVLNTFTHEYFENMLESNAFKIYLYKQDNHLIACVIANLESSYKSSDNGYEIDTLYVQEHFQGLGLGKILLYEMAKNFGDNFWLSTWVHNTPAIEFYNYLGFKDIGEIKFRLDNELHENRVLAINNLLKDM